MNNYKDNSDSSNYNAYRIFDNLPDLIRPHKAAKVLDISINTIYDWKYRGKTRNVPDNLFMKMNRSLYINTEVLRRWIAQQN